MTITVVRCHAKNGNRYEIDAVLCPAGWAQLDRAFDTSCYGMWANPRHLSITAYAEGDMYSIHCETAEEFCSEIRTAVALIQEMNKWKDIDPGPKPEDRQIWIDLGLGDLLH